MAINSKTDVNADSLHRIGNDSFDPTFRTNITQVLGFDGQNLQRMNADGLQLQLDYNGGTNPVYVGSAAPGTATSLAFWQIKKLTYDGSNNVTAIQYAAGAPNFNQIWDNRTSLSYS